MDNWVIVVGVLFVVFAAGAAVFFWQQTKTAVMAKENAEAEVKKRQAEVEKSQAEVEKWQAETEKWRGENEKAQSAMTEARTRAESIEQHVEGLRKDNEQLRKQNKEHAGEISKLTTELENANKNAEEKIALLQDVEENMLTKFESLSESVLEKKNTKFNEESSKLLKPVRDELEKFQNRVNVIHTKDIEDRSALIQQIKDLQENAEQYGKSADNLASVIKGDSKARGNWGEIQLETLLQRAGLIKDEEYKAQPTMRGEDGKILRPDFKINLPDNKHFIIDSKVPLTAYYNFFNAEGKDEKKAALANHVQVIKKHVNDLSSRHYTKATGVNAPDFVFMFMPLEPALIDAFHSEPELFAKAYEKSIILCSPTTMMATMRTVERVWRVERQNINAHEIAKQGGDIHDKFCGFLDNMADVEKALRKAQESHHAANEQLQNGKGNLIRRVEKLKKLGVPTKKKIHVDYASVQTDDDDD